MTHQDISAPEVPASDAGVTDTPAGAAPAEPAKPKRGGRRKTPAVAAEGESTAAPVRRSRKSAKPVDGEQAAIEIVDGETIEAAPPVKKAPARKRSPRKTKAPETGTVTALEDAPTEEAAAAVTSQTVEALPEAAEAAEVTEAQSAAAVVDEPPVPPAVEAVMPEAVAEEEAVAEPASDLEDHADDLPATEAQIEAGADASPLDSPARRKRRRKKRKAQGGDETASAQPVPTTTSGQADLPFAAEEVAAETPVEPFEATGRITVIGLTPGLGLAEHDRAALLAADRVLVDGALEAQGVLPEGLAMERLPGSFATLCQRIEALADRRVVVVVAGDPVCEGPGRALLAEFGPARVALRPAVGRVQAALARAGLALEDAIRVDQAAVGMAGLVARLHAGRLYAVTLDAGTRPQDIGRRLEAAGFHQARIWLVEPGEAGAIHALLGFELSDSRIEFAAGAVLAIYTALGDGSLNDWPGLPAPVLSADALPEALRLLALAWLQPSAEETGWAIEPGAAALALDWSRHRPAAAVFAIGSEPAWLASVRLVVGAGEGLQAVTSGAHRSLAELPDPDLIFIRASDELGQQIRTGWERLRPGGRMVVVAEDEQARVDLMHFANRTPAQRWQEVSVAEGGSHAGRPRLEPARGARIMLWKKPVRG